MFNTTCVWDNSFCFYQGMKNSYHSDSLRFSFLKLAFPAKLAIVWLHIDLILYIKSMFFTSLKVREEQHGLYTRESEH